MPRRFNAFRLAIFFACLAPFAWLLWDIYHDSLGADPIQQITHRSGSWTLRFVLLTLAVTPLRRLSGWNELIKLRRMFGLYAFFYASVHFATFLVLDLGGFWSQIFDDIAKRPFITVGFLAWLLMLPLALTSTKAMMRRLGRRWQSLHRLVYVCALLGVVHFIWLVKADLREPMIYLAVLALLMGARLYWRLRARTPTAQTRAATSRGQS